MIECPKSTYMRPAFSFSTGKEWHSCRETFHRSIACKDTKDFFFCVSTHKTRIIQFIEECESRLGLEVRSEILDTDDPRVVFIKTSTWWVLQPIRFSLFTILLRCAQNYEGNFLTTLYSKSYTRSTKTAVERFFSGHTWYIGKGRMWVSTFGNCSRNINFAEKSLIKKDDIKASQKSLEIAKNIVSESPNKELLCLKIAQALDNSFEAGKNEVPNDLLQRRQTPVDRPDIAATDTPVC